jgi:hypothetical protein
MVIAYQVVIEPKIEAWSESWKPEGDIEAYN